MSDTERCLRCVGRGVVMSYPRRKRGPALRARECPRCEGRSVVPAGSRNPVYIPRRRRRDDGECMRGVAVDLMTFATKALCALGGSR